MSGSSKKKKKSFSTLKNNPVMSSGKAKFPSKVDSGIPKPVANRMARRIAFTTGLPTFGGMSVFIGSYVLISKGILDIPPALTLISSAALFFLGLIGLSYGILSASWDKNPGTLLGLENIRPNITRMRSSFNQVNKQEPEDNTDTN